MKQIDGMFWEPEFYAVYEFRTAVCRPDWDGMAVVDQIFKRKIKLFCLPDVDGLLRYQLLTVAYTFEGTATPAFIRRIAYVFDEVVFKVDMGGRLQKIENIDRIKARWVATKAELEIDHKGRTIESYFNAIDQLLEDEEALLDFLSTPKMFGMLFSGMTAEGHVQLFNEFNINGKRKKGENTTWDVEDDWGNKTGQFSLTKYYLEQGYLKSGNTQYEILWLGKQKI